MNKGIMVEELPNKMQLDADKDKEMAIIKQDEWYENTQFYNNYISYTQNVDAFSYDLLSQFKNEYYANAISFKNPFHHKIKKVFTLYISSHIPEMYLEYLRDTYCKAFARYNDLMDTDIEVEIKRVEYFKVSSNMVKWEPSCILKIELVDKLKKDKVKIK